MANLKQLLPHHCKLGIWLLALTLTSFAPVMGQSCNLDLYIGLEGHKAESQPVQVVAENLKSHKKFNSVEAKRGNVLSNIPYGNYLLTLKSAGFGTSVVKIAVSCKKAPDNKLHSNLVMCRGDETEIFDDGITEAYDNHTSVPPASPTFVCRQHRMKPVAARELEMNKTSIWKEVTRSTEGTPYFTDLGNFERSGNFVTFRVRSENAQSTNYFTIHGNCIGQTVRTTNHFAEFPGTLGLTALENDDGQFRVADGTVLEGLLAFACNPSTEKLSREPILPLKPPPKQISGGVLNGIAISLPVPAYPSAARSMRISGTVVVKVLIDEQGKVIAAEAASGHPLLAVAATDAALKAIFKPVLYQGIAVKVSGVIRYSFSP